MGGKKTFVSIIVYKSFNIYLCLYLYSIEHAICVQCEIVLELFIKRFYNGSSRRNISENYVGILVFYNIVMVKCVIIQLQLTLNVR